jgi:imidazole glycerol-phosphate synthase subunit HisH
VIAVIDYGLGNLYSVAGAIERLGYEARITDDPREIRAAEKIVLPGVGAFGDGMKNLRNRGLVELLTEQVQGEHKPILGICLGLQLMANGSSEFGYHQGLGWIDASVSQIPTNGIYRVPHVGWNDLRQRRPSVLFEGVPADALFYYVHSYHLHCADTTVVIGECEYGINITAAVEQGNVYGTQFHPEKSQQWGLKLLSNFLART